MLYMLSNVDCVGLQVNGTVKLLYFDNLLICVLYVTTIYVMHTHPMA